MQDTDGRLQTVVFAEKNSGVEVNTPVQQGHLRADFVRGDLFRSRSVRKASGSSVKVIEDAAAKSGPDRRVDIDILRRLIFDHRAPSDLIEVRGERHARHSTDRPTVLARILKISQATADLESLGQLIGGIEESGPAFGLGCSDAA